MNLEEIINLTLNKVMGKKPTQKGSSFTQHQQDKEQLTQQGYNPMTGKFPDALQKAIINKTNEHHLKGNPNAKYVATAAPQGWFDVWEGEPFDENGENGVLVGKFKSMKDAKEYADTKNAEQGKLEEYEVDTSDFKPSDAGKASLKTLDKIRSLRQKRGEPKTSDPTIAQRGGHDKVYKDYLKEDINRIIALEAKREKLQAELNAINSELEKLQASQQQYGFKTTDELESIAMRKPDHPSLKGDRRYRGPKKNK